MLKRKHTTLNLAQKCEILNLIQTKQTFQSIADQYGVGKSTISDINKNKAKLLEYVTSSDGCPGGRKTLKLSSYPVMEKDLFAWYLEEKTKGVSLTNEMICEKAKLLKCDDFKASSGWLHNFKDRFGIKIKSKNLAVFNVEEKLLVKIREMDLGVEQIYSADKSDAERVAFLPCANISGTHKLRLLIVGRDCFLDNSFVCYKTNKRECVSEGVFREWFNLEFVPSVRERLQERNLPQRALLIVDNGFSRNLVSEDKEIVVMNCEGMNQNVIQAVKFFYREKCRRSKSDVFSIPEKVDLLIGAWERVSESLIQKSWKSLILKLTVLLKEKGSFLNNNISHKDAISSFNNCIQWASENNIAHHHIFLLHELRDKALRAEELQD